MTFKNSLKRHIGDIFALCGLVAVTALITSIILTAPPLTKSGPPSATDHTLLVLMVTVAGTIFSALIASRIRHLMLRLVDSTLQRSMTPPGSLPGASATLARLDTKWRGILAIDSISEKSGNLPIVLIYVFCALMTTSIVTTFTPVTYVRTLSYHPLIPDANYDPEKSCVYMANSSFADPRAYSWSLPNGSHFFILRMLADAQHVLPRFYPEILTQSVQTSMHTRTWGSQSKPVRLELQCRYTLPNRMQA
jgi:hypothetical protein